MKVLTITDSPLLFSGLARVHRHVIDMLIEQGHQVLPCVWFGYDNVSLQMIKSGKKLPPLVYKSGDTDVQMLSIPKRNNEVKNLYEVLNISRPDLVITIGDYWDFYYMHALKIKMDFSFKWLAYFTVERDELDDKLLPLFKYVDYMTVPTEFGKAVIEPACDCPVEVVPYGVEKGFRRLPEARRQELREERDCTDKIRFITVAQNTWRKNLPALMHAMKVIAHRDPQKNMQFYIHTNVDASDPQEASVFDLRSIASKLGVEDWFQFPEDGTCLFNAPGDDTLVDEYNAADFFVLPSTCEGFGLPILEGMACGLPAMVNATSCMPEHVGKAWSDSGYGPTDRGWLVSNRLEICPPDIFAKVIRHDALGQAIWELGLWMKDKDKREALERMRHSSIEYAKGRTWEGMKGKMNDVIRKAMGPVSIPVEVVR